MKYELVIFDLDGTLLDTIEDLCASVNYALKAFSFPGRSLDEVRSFVGNGIHKLIESSLPEGASCDETEQVFKAFKEHYKENCNVKTKPYDGIKELLHKLKSSGVRTAVVSNKAQFGVKTLCDSHFPGLLDECVGEREGIQRKPSPESVFAVISSLSCSKEKCLYIGDSEVDIKTARNADVDFIAVSWGFRSREVLNACGNIRIADNADILGEMIARS